MVAGHLQEKNGIYYVVLTYKTYDGKRKTKWQSTGLPTKGNKKRAEAMMRELQDDFEPPVDPNEMKVRFDFITVKHQSASLLAKLCPDSPKVHA